MRLGCTASLHPGILHHTVWKVVEGGGEQKGGRKWAKGGSYRSPVELWPLPSTVMRSRNAVHPFPTICFV